MKKFLVLALACTASLTAFGQYTGSEVRRGARESNVRESIREHGTRGDRVHRTARHDRRHHTPRYYAPRPYYTPVHPSYGFTPGFWYGTPRYAVGYPAQYAYGTPYRANRGDAATTGALLGAGLGAIIGHNDGSHGVEGAIIGGFLGALLGSAVDEGRDRRDRGYATAPGRVTVYDERPSYGFATSAANYNAPAAAAAIRYSTPAPGQREFRRPAIAVSRAGFTSR